MSRLHRTRTWKLRAAINASIGMGVAYGLRGFCYLPDGGDGGGGAAGGSGDGEGGKGKAGDGAGEMIPKSEAQAAFKQRDEAKKAAKALRSQVAELLGVEPDELNDEQLAAAREELAEARKAKQKGSKWEDRENELNSKHQAKVQKLAQTHEAAVTARDAYIRDAAVLSPIRVACAAEKAVDIDGGSYGDIVALVANRVKVETAVDEESGKLSVTVSPLNEDGTPMLDSKGKPATVRQLVKEFLDKRPHLRQANFRNGPGAGGHGGGSGQGNGAVGTNGKGNVDWGRRFLGLPT